MIKEIINESIKENISATVLNDLPEWFGIPKYTNDYIEKSKKMPFFAYYLEDEAVGFLALKETSVHTVEIFCMGVLKKYQGLGYGKAILDIAQKHASKNGYKFLQVKTVQVGKYEVYDQTNVFYRSCGFYVLEVFPTLWDESNPCQVLIKVLN